MALAIRDEAAAVTSLWGRAGRVPGEAPLAAIGRGAVAGLVATALLSVLSRLTEPLWKMGGLGGSGGGSGGSKPKAPPDPFDPESVREWQRHYQSPAAYEKGSGGQGAGSSVQGGGQAAAVSPAQALAQSHSPGPEGIAAQFARKLAFGMFDSNVSRYAQAAGETVHFAYGTAWGALYGLVQASVRRAPGPLGLVFGLVVWLVGPALLVPAMRLMPPPQRESRLRLALMVLGHLVYGLAVAGVFELQERRAGEIE